MVELLESDELSPPEEPAPAIYDPPYLPTIILLRKERQYVNDIRSRDVINARRAKCKRLIHVSERDKVYSRFFSKRETAPSISLPVTYGWLVGMITRKENAGSELWTRNACTKNMMTSDVRVLLRDLDLFRALYLRK